MPRIDRLNGKPIYKCTPDELRAAAAQRRRAEAESFARSDTDGFLSQWALTLTAQLYERQAEINENGGTAPFVALFYGERMIADREYTFPAYNAPWQTVRKWRVPDDLVSTFGRRWVPVGGKSRVQKQLGLEERAVSHRAVAVVHAPGKGLSGSANAAVITVRLDRAEEE